MIVALDGDELAGEYAATRARMRDVLGGIGSEEASTVVPACPDWTIRDLAAHLAGVAADLAAGRRPDGDTQAWVDRQVAERSDRSVDELLDEWDRAGPDFEDGIRRSPAGLGGLLYDVVAHEHDARGALHRPGGRDAPGVRLSVDIMANMVEKDLAAHGLGPVRLSDGTHTWRIGDGEPGLVVETGSTWELMRLIGSRRSLAQVRAAPIDGDLDAYRPGLFHLPLPDDDLQE